MLFAVAIVVSATLLLWIQPVFAKSVIPSLGGGASVWNVVLACFQTLLLAGYWYAHSIAKLRSAKLQSAIHAIVIVTSTSWLSLVHNDYGLSALNATQSPVMWILKTFLIQVGLVYFLLSTTSTLLQSWYSNINHSSDNVYKFYIVSNLGSMIGVFGYIIIIEPLFGLHFQKTIFSYCFFFLAALLLAVAGIHWKQGKVAPLARDDSKTLLRRKLKWVAISAIPSALLLAVTTHITTEIAPVPLVWMLMLGLYLISFVVAFSKWKRISFPTLLKVQVTLCVPLLADFMLDIVASGGISMMLWHVCAFFITAVVCHKILYDSRPHPSQLTEFYLCIALGGAVGGSFTALLAPAIFSSYFEYPMLMALAFAARPAKEPLKENWKKDVAISGATLAVLFLALFLMKPLLSPYNAFATPLLLMTGFFTIKFCFDQEGKPIRLAGCFAAAIIAGVGLNAFKGKIAYQERNFYGVITVDKSNPEVIGMRHGTTKHGIQYIDKTKSQVPLAYFHPSGPLGDFLPGLVAEKQNIEVAGVGLGAGSVACYGKKGSRFTFFEINPAVIKIARNPNFFSYLSGCLPQVDIVEGDARIMLGGDTRKFDVIILDAFTSDSIPIHILTKEAFQLYRKRLADDGIITVHISNRFLNLLPVLKGISENMGMALVASSDKDRSQDKFKFGSDWAIIGEKRVLEGLRLPKRWYSPAEETKSVLWTDDFSNIIGMLKLY